MRVLNGGTTKWDKKTNEGRCKDVRRAGSMARRRAVMKDWMRFQLTNEWITLPANGSHAAGETRIRERGRAKLWLLLSSIKKAEKKVLCGRHRTVLPAGQRPERLLSSTKDLQNTHPEAVVEDPWSPLRTSNGAQKKLGELFKTRFLTQRWTSSLTTATGSSLRHTFQPGGWLEVRSGRGGGENSL